MSTSKDSSNGLESDPDAMIDAHNKRVEDHVKMSATGTIPKVPMGATAAAPPLAKVEDQQVLSKEEFEKLMDTINDKYPEFDQILRNIPKGPGLQRTTAFRIPDKPTLPPSLVKMRQEAADLKKTLKKAQSSAKHDKTRESSPDNNNFGPVELSEEHDRLYANILQEKRQERIDQELQKLSDKFSKWDLNPDTQPVFRMQPVKRPAPPTIVSEPTKLMKADIDTNKLLMEQAQLMTNIVQALGTHTEIAQLNEIKKKTIEHAEKAIKKKQETTEQEAMIKRSAALTEKYQRTPKLPSKVPKASTPIVYLPSDVEAACGTYDPKDTNADFAKVWDNLLYMGIDNGYQTEDYMRALGYILKGDARDVYNQCRANNDDLEDVLQRLTNAYAKQRTVTEDRRALENFTRKSAEPLLQCMSRCDILIDKLQPFHTPEAWPSVREFFKRMALLQVVSKQTKRKILFMEDDIIKNTGVPCDTNHLISYADTYEVRHDEVPQTEVKTIFHCATAEPVPKEHKEIKKMSKEIQQLKNELTNMTQKVTAFSTTTQDVTMTDTSVRPNKRSRDDDSSSRAVTNYQSKKPQDNRKPPPTSEELKKRNDNQYNNNKYDKYKDERSKFYYNKDYKTSHTVYKPQYNQDYKKNYDNRRNNYDDYKKNYNKDYKQSDYKSYDRGRSYDRNDNKYYNRSRSYDDKYQKRDYKRQNYKRDYRSSSYDRNYKRDYRDKDYYRRDRNTKEIEYDKYIIPDKTGPNAVIPYRPNEVKQVGSGNIIFNMEG
jgi:hypothetical protein